MKGDRMEIEVLNDDVAKRWNVLGSSRFLRIYNLFYF